MTGVRRFCEMQCLKARTTLRRSESWHNNLVSSVGRGKSLYNGPKVLGEDEPPVEGFKSHFSGEQQRPKGRRCIGQGSEKKMEEREPQGSVGLSGANERRQAALSWFIS